MRVGWQRLSTESAGVGEKRLRLSYNLQVKACPFLCSGDIHDQFAKLPKVLILGPVFGEGGG